MAQIHEETLFFLYHVYQVINIVLKCLHDHDLTKIILATINQGLLVQPEPTLFVTKTAIKSNEIGVFVTYYSEYVFFFT